MVIVTEWVQFRALDLERLKREMAQPVVVDLRNIYRPEDMAAHGFIYESVGRRAERGVDASSLTSPRLCGERSGCIAVAIRVRGIAVQLSERCSLDRPRQPSPARAGRGSSDRMNCLPRSFDTPLPIDAVLDELARTLARSNAAVLVAPPGAGKTTRVPLALLDAPWLKDKKIIVLEPRRIAARASAERMAKTLGERVGETVGYRVRFGSKVSRATRIEVVTEGIFSRQILDDPELTGVAAVLFDEFHERSLDADLGLALARDAQTGLREDLRILVMSATLDGARVAKLLGEAPVIASEGRAFPVETRYLGRKADAPLERQMADAIATALRADPGSVLAFLPGAAEIRRTQNFLAERVHDASIEIVPLFGALDAARAGPRHRAGAEGPAQGGAGDLDRGDLADHRGRAHRGRFRRGAGAALRAGYRADAAGDRARLARRGRSAPRPRRPHRARRLLPAVGRAADRVAGGLYPAGNPQRRSVVAGARSRAMGRQRSRDAGVSRSAAGAGAEGGAAACCANSARSTAMAGSPPKARACARWRCRRGWRA